MLDLAPIRALLATPIPCDHCGARPAEYEVSGVDLDYLKCEVCADGETETPLGPHQTTERAYLAALLSEVDRLQSGGCARDQGLTQFCAEAVARDAEIRRLRSELAAAQAGPVVEWRHLPGSAGWERADVGQFSLLLMGDSAWRLICGDQAVIARGSPGGDAGKAAAEAAYRRACGFPTAPPCAV